MGKGPVTLDLMGGSTSLSQATQPGQTAAPFLPLPSRMDETSEPIASGPGSRVAGDLLRGSRAPELPQQWTLTAGAPSTLVVLPIPVAGLDPLLNGRNIQLRLRSSAPVYLATLAARGNKKNPPSLKRWQELLRSGRLSPKEHQPPPGKPRKNHLLPRQWHPNRQPLERQDHRSRADQPGAARPSGGMADQQPRTRRPGHRPGANR